MRILLFPFLLLLASCAGKKEENKLVKNENKDYLVSFGGIGNITTDMNQHDLEKLLNQKIPLTNPTDTISGSWTDSARIKYKEGELNLTFVRSYMDVDSFHMRLSGIKTKDEIFKTAEGLGVGSTKQQIIDTYTQHTVILSPDYADTTYTTFSKSLHSINVRQSWEGAEIVFYLKDNKVYAIQVGTFYDDQE